MYTLRTSEQVRENSWNFYSATLTTVQKVNLSALKCPNVMMFLVLEIGNRLFSPLSLCRSSITRTIET